MPQFFDTVRQLNTITDEQLSKLYTTEQCIEAIQHFSSVVSLMSEIDVDEPATQQVQLVETERAASTKKSLVAQKSSPTQDIALPVRSIESDQLRQVTSTRAAEEQLPKCERCQQPATNRCSLCKRIFYCSRPCQEGDWSAHKSQCKQWRAEAASVTSTATESASVPAEAQVHITKPMIEMLD